MISHSREEERKAQKVKGQKGRVSASPKWQKLSQSDSADLRSQVLFYTNVLELYCATDGCYTPEFLVQSGAFSHSSPGILLLQWPHLENH